MYHKDSWSSQTLLESSFALPDSFRLTVWRVNCKNKRSSLNRIQERTKSNCVRTKRTWNWRTVVKLRLKGFGSVQIKMIKDSLCSTRQLMQLTPLLAWIFYNLLSSLQLLSIVAFFWPVDDFNVHVVHLCATNLHATDINIITPANIKLPSSFL